MVNSERPTTEFAERVKIFDDPWTGRRYTTCSRCQGKVGPHDRFCKHCGRRFRDVGECAGDYTVD